MNNISDKILCALDTSEIKRASELADLLKGHVGAIKLGLEFFTANGAEGVNLIRDKGVPIFLDLKFHDIPNTVANAVRSAVRSMDVFMLTIHTSGGKEMMQAAVNAAEEAAWRVGKPKPIVVGVTSLTSLDPADLHDIGIDRPINEHIVHMADLARKSGLDGVVCPAYEIQEIRAVCGKNFKIVVPGIRPEGNSLNDQKRVATPKGAIDNGADYIVIGRPIVESDNPVATANKIVEEIAA